MKSSHLLAALATASLLTMSMATTAEDAQPGSGQLPLACKKAASFDPSMGAMHPDSRQERPDRPMGVAVGQDAGHQALIAGMTAMHLNMDVGMTASDIDMAFVCGMIPHHQGAIDMAKAVIAFGNDPWTKQLAQNIIDAQMKELGEKQAWLDKQGK